VGIPSELLRPSWWCVWELAGDVRSGLDQQRHSGSQGGDTVGVGAAAAACLLRTGEPRPAGKGWGLGERAGPTTIFSKLLLFMGKWN
jgi:hypothetical protein